MKKLIAMLMAGAMILALSVPAFAEGEPPTSPTQEELDAAAAAAAAAAEAAKYENPKTAVDSTGQYVGTTKTNAAVNEPIVSISLPKVPPTGGFILNPYKMTYSTDFTLVAAAEGSAAVTTGVSNSAQKSAIVSPTYVIKSMSNVPLKVGLTVTTEPSGNIKFASSTVKDGDTGNNLFLRVIMGNTTSATSSGSATMPTDVTPLVLKSGSATLAAKDQPTIPAAVGVEKDADTGTITATTAKYFAFAFDGNLSDSAIKPWVAGDKVGVEMAWSFMPVIAASN